MYQIKSADGVIRYSLPLSGLIMKYFNDVKNEYGSAEIWHNNCCYFKYVPYEEDEYFDENEIDWEWED